MSGGTAANAITALTTDVEATGPGTAVAHVVQMRVRDADPGSPVEDDTAWIARDGGSPIETVTLKVQIDGQTHNLASLELS